MVMLTMMIGGYYLFQELSEAEDKPFKQKNKPSDPPTFKGVLGKIISKVAENKKHDPASKIEIKVEKESEGIPEKESETKPDKPKESKSESGNEVKSDKANATKSGKANETKVKENESLNAVKQLFKIAVDEKEAASEAIKNNKSNSNLVIKDDPKPSYPMGSMISHGHKPPCICPDKSKCFAVFTLRTL